MQLPVEASESLDGRAKLTRLRMLWICKAVVKQVTNNVGKHVLPNRPKQEMVLVVASQFVIRKAMDAHRRWLAPQHGELVQNCIPVADEFLVQPVEELFFWPEPHKLVQLLADAFSRP